MWIRDVNLPEELIDAQRRGRLVLFVGAGASIAPPSDLPDFRTLAAEIAADGNVPASEEQLEQTDVFLGTLKDQHNIDVHTRVAARIGISTSRPNSLHRAILALATAGSPPRIVTTNYDLHLSTVASDNGLALSEYVAPALPIGDDFTGLVYLHGNLRHEPQRLIVTDTDLGRAYLRDGWAARFLERMFHAYTVLFVGYRHADVVVSYLARGLGSTSARYAITSDPDSSHWRRLWINPVGYPKVEDSHDALVHAVEGWSDWASMGLLGHQQRVAQLVSASPSQVPEDESYLEAVVADPEKVGFFAEHARGAEWLRWAMGQPEFRRLFDPAMPATRCSTILSYWFAQHVIDEDLSQDALSIVRDAGGRLGFAVWSAIGQAFHSRQKPRAKWLDPWLVVLVQNAPEAMHQLLDYALVASQWPDDRATALMLFDYLCEPQAILQPGFGPASNTRIDVRLRGHPHWLRDGWERVFVPNLLEAAPEILGYMDRHLRRAHQLFAAGGAGGSALDPMALYRSAIEPHEQDSLEWPWDILVEAARDCLETLLRSADGLAYAYMQAWAASAVPLLRRLAVHGWVERSDVSATDKLVWLRERGWIFDHQLRHEVFRLIGTTLASADREVADALVATAAAGPQDGGEYRDYEVFNLLIWMGQHAPELESARKALDQIQSEHPEFQRRTHPDLLTWFEPGWESEQPPMSAQALHDRIDDDVEAALTELRSYEGAHGPFDKPGWNDALGALSETVRQWPNDGFAVLNAQDGNHPEIVRSVIHGWSRAIIDDTTAEMVMLRLGTLDLEHVSDEVAMLLSEGGKHDPNSADWHRFPTARDLAARLWELIRTEESVIEGRDWLARAINHPAGWLAQFWLNAISVDWREAGDNWTGLPVPIRTQLERLLSGSDVRTAMAEVIVASHLHFFFSADRAWCERHVLPLLDWADAPRATRNWDGFLLWGRWNDRLLKAGLLPQYLAATQHIGEFEATSRRQLLQHLASVALYSEIDPMDHGWLLTFTTGADVTSRTEWMNEVSWLLPQLAPEAIEHQWQRWMSRYWRSRLESVPMQLTVDEASAMARWTIYLTDSMAEAARLGTQWPARLSDHSTLLAEVTDDRVAWAPAELAMLLTHLLQGTQTPFWECHDLERIVGILRRQTNPVDIRPILEEALRLGCARAHEW